MGLLDRSTERVRRTLWTAMQIARSEGAPLTRDHLLLGIPQDGMANVALTEMGCSLSGVHDEVRLRRADQRVIADSNARMTDAAKSHLEAAGLLPTPWRQTFDLFGDEHLLATYLEDWASDSWHDLPAHVRNGLAQERLGCEVLRDAGVVSDRFRSTLKEVLGLW